jgi:hypothetical protein
LFGEIITTVTNPKSPTVTRILERVGLDPIVFQRTTQAQKAFREALIAEELRLNPNFRADGFSAHHIIPLKDFPELGQLRARFAEWGIDPYSVQNGVMLPTYATSAAGAIAIAHGVTMRYEYADTLIIRFENVQTAAQARTLLSQIQTELRNGTFQFIRR